MFKLIILFHQPRDLLEFDTGWQAFLGMVEQMPGLRRESVSLIASMIFGDSKSRPFKIHELCFDDLSALQAALASDAGQQAGEWLHRFTEGNFTLLTASHQEARPKDFRKKKGRARSV
jgi:uncharacterized protein (TIGR02118 family)